MDGGSVLALMKWAALLLGLASTLWALLGSEPTVEDAAGRKRLTASGSVTLALIIVSAMVAATSFGFETLTNRADTAAALAEKRQAAAAQAFRDQRDQLTDAETRAIRAEQRVAVAESRAAAAGQRAMAIALASEARSRDLVLSREVGIGASRNLERTGRALNALERLLQPLEPLTVALVWELGPEVPGVAAWGARAAAEVRRRDAEGQRRVQDIAAGTVYCRIDCGFSPTTMLQIVPGDALYPLYDRKDRSGETDLFAHLSTLRATLAFFAEGFAEPVLIARLAKARKALTGEGDLGLTVSRGSQVRNHEDQPIIEYVAATGALRVKLQGEVALDRMDRSEAIVSFPDLERSLLLIELADGPGRLPGHPAIRPIELTLASPTRAYRAQAPAFARVDAIRNRSIFRVTALEREQQP